MNSTFIAHFGQGSAKTAFLFTIFCARCPSHAAHRTHSRCCTFVAHSQQPTVRSSPSVVGSPSRNASNGCGVSQASGRRWPGGPGDRGTSPQEERQGVSAFGHSIFIAYFEQGPAKTAICIHRPGSPSPAPRTLRAATGTPPRLPTQAAASVRGGRWRKPWRRAHPGAGHRPLMALARWRRRALAGAASAPAARSTSRNTAAWPPIRPRRRLAGRPSAGLRPAPPETPPAPPAPA